MHVKISGFSIEQNLTIVFQVIYTEQSGNSVCVLQPPEPETPEVFENEVDKTPEPKEWISLGSELEIDEESVKETREKALQYNKTAYICAVCQISCFFFNMCVSFAPLSLFCLYCPHQLRYKFSRVRRKFGMPVCFSDNNTADSKDSYLECPSYQDSRFSIKQMQRDCMVQAVPRLQSSSTQTKWYANKSVHMKCLCSAGGRHSEVLVVQ